MNEVFLILDFSYRSSYQSLTSMSMSMNVSFEPAGTLPYPYPYPSAAD